MAAAEIVPNGTILKGFEIIKPLGKGKFSIVYQARRQSDGQLCALKKINIFDMMDPKQRDKCLKEVRMLKELAHPNIVRFIDCFMDEKELLIILEWAERGDLKRLLRRAAQNDVWLNEGQIWEYMRQLACALAHMQEKRIMHRDIKPANIFLSEDGTLKIGDLGLGRFFSSQTMEAFSKVGTPLYMSPEVLKGDGYDMKSDVWSLGCVLYELAMRRSPFKTPDQQMNLYDLFLKISNCEYEPLPDTFSAEMRKTVNGMLQKEVKQRMSMADVAAFCTDMAGPQQRACRPSPHLIMDDIVEKLKILEAEDKFFRPRNLPPLHRCFFAMKCDVAPGISQLALAVELMHWLVALGAPADASAGPPPPRDDVGQSVRDSQADLAAGCQPVRWVWYDPSRKGEEQVSKLTQTLATRGLKISSETTLSQLRQGHGEGVCLLLNELINQELVRRNFHFLVPEFGEAQDDEVEEELAEPDPGMVLAPSHASTFVEEDASEDEPASPGGVLEPVHFQTVDPEAWREELERVQDQLLVAAPPSRRQLMQDLVARLKLAAKLARKVPACSQPHCQRWHAELAVLRRGEQHVQGVLQPRVAEHAKVRQGIQEFRAKAVALRDSLEHGQAELQELELAHERVQEELKHKAQLVQSDDRVGRLKDAVERLREDNRVMSLRIGVVQQQLGRARLKGGRDTGDGPDYS